MEGKNEDDMVTAMNAVRIAIKDGSSKSNRMVSRCLQKDTERRNCWTVSSAMSRQV